MNKLLKFAVPVLAGVILFAGCTNKKDEPKVVTSETTTSEKGPFQNIINKNGSLESFYSKTYITMDTKKDNKDPKTTKLTTELTTTNKGKNLYISNTSKDMPSLKSEVYMDETTLLFKPSDSKNFLDITNTANYSAIVGDVYSGNGTFSSSKLIKKAYAILNESKDLKFEDKTKSIEDTKLNFKTVNVTIPGKDARDDLIEMFKGTLEGDFKTKEELASFLSKLTFGDVNITFYINKDDIIKSTDISVVMSYDKFEMKVTMDSNLIYYNDKAIALPKIDKSTVKSYDEYTKSKEKTKSNK
ncbi:hypothetical protein [Clostridium hydrogeniformans]|uniref:hypothetical protein n=1 Tax=Clostridium hydrogeniformans TaxID=349933 RepID=UPI000480A129|nr:hypothetical protein [Clostridium hydrogeniformans]